MTLLTRLTLTPVDVSRKKKWLRTRFSGTAVATFAVQKHHAGKPPPVGSDGVARDCPPTLSAQLRVFLLQLFLIVVEGKVGLQDSELESTDRTWTFGDNSNDRLCWTHASRAVFVSSARITGIEFSALPNREPISPST